MSSKPDGEPARAQTIKERLKIAWERFRANFRKSLKGPLITRPHLEMSDRDANGKDAERPS